MRLRLFLSFVLIVLVTISGVLLIGRQGTAGAVRAYMLRGGMSGLEELVTDLETYYQQNGSWQGVAPLLSDSLRMGAGMGQGQGQGMGAQHMGMMNQRLRLADSAGNVLVDSDGQAAGGSLSRDELRSAITLQSGGKTVGYLLPEGGMEFSQLNETQLVERITRAAWIAGLAAGLLALLLALLLAYSLLRPVHALTAAAQRMTQGDLSQRVDVRGKDELAALGRAFNRMAESLQRAEESRQAMTADIAHELRNPLAVQRATLEALQDGVYPLNGDNLTPILEQNKLLTRLVEDLRTLALADAGQLRLERTPADLAALTRRMVERHLPQAAGRDIHIELAQDDAFPAGEQFTLDAMRVEQIVGNLLSNALRYTPDGGAIRLELGWNGRAARLEVHDSGPGIPPEALERVFERFYRADKARSRSEGGSGLGLAIARHLAQAHGGELTAANHPQGGALFTLTLPKSHGE
jgi:two-component system OmpR family sensor kinase/two-component system sensor histidine kinase BaeS